MDKQKTEESEIDDCERVIIITGTKQPRYVIESLLRKCKGNVDEAVNTVLDEVDPILWLEEDLQKIYKGKSEKETSSWIPKVLKDFLFRKVDELVKSVDITKIPRIGTKSSIDSLFEDYQHGNPIIKQKILELSSLHKIKFWRRIRGDGNCMYSSFTLVLMEDIYNNQILRNQILEVIKDTYDYIQNWVENRIDTHDLGLISIVGNEWSNCFHTVLNFINLANTNIIKKNQEISKTENKLNSPLSSLICNQPKYSVKISIKNNNETIYRKFSIPSSFNYEEFIIYLANFDDFFLSLLDNSMALYYLNSDNVGSELVINETTFEKIKRIREKEKEIIEIKKELSINFDDNQKVDLRFCAKENIEAKLGRKDEKKNKEILIDMKEKLIDRLSKNSYQNTTTQNFKIDQIWEDNEFLILHFDEVLRFVVFVNFMKNYDHNSIYFDNKCNIQKKLQDIRTMGSLAEQFEICQLASAFNKKVVLFQLDNSNNSLSSYQILEDTKWPHSEADVVLLFRPGHYDILFSS